MTEDQDNEIGLLAEEYVERARNGERPTISEYVRRRPDLEAGIRAPAPWREHGALTGVHRSGGSDHRQVAHETTSRAIAVVPAGDSIHSPLGTGRIRTELPVDRHG